MPDRRAGLGRVVLAAMAVTIPVAAPGCGSMRVTSTSRSGTEQLLLSTAWDKALAGVDFRPLAPVPVYLDTTNLESLDTGWMIYRIRQAMIRQGVRLVDEPEDAVAIVEASVGTYGTDVYDWLIGIPQMPVPVGMLGIPAGVSSMPELSLAKKTRQYGLVKLSLFAHDRATGRYVWDSGTIIADSKNKSTFIGGLGPIESGTVRQQIGNRGVLSELPRLPEPAHHGGR